MCDVDPSDEAEEMGFAVRGVADEPAVAAGAEEGGVGVVGREGAVVAVVGEGEAVVAGFEGEDVDAAADAEVAMVAGGVAADERPLGRGGDAPEQDAGGEEEAEGPAATPGGLRRVRVGLVAVARAVVAVVAVVPVMDEWFAMSCGGLRWFTS